ncbi:MAG TPA: hypothetical protein VEO00_12275, partial [Actinomycetota bacterium]|nr:hypothetical protein [Actinomycetota bacterium]
TTTTTTTTTKPPGGGCTIPIQCTTQSHAPAAVTAGPSTNAIAIGVALLALLLGASIAARARHPA